LYTGIAKYTGQLQYAWLANQVCILWCVLNKPFCRVAPQDWDVLYLDATSTQHGRAVSPHVVAIRWTAGTVGYVATPSFARTVLRAASNPRLNKWVDLLYGVRTVLRSCHAGLDPDPGFGAVFGFTWQCWLALQALHQRPRMCALPA
jgi:hypothetical protein